MSNSELFLKKGIYGTFLNQDKSIRKSELLKQNFSIVIKNEEDVDNVLQRAKEIGLFPLASKDILIGSSLLLNQTGTILPKNKSLRAETVKKILDGIVIRKEQGELIFLDTDGNNLKLRYESLSDNQKESIERLVISSSKDAVAMGQVRIKIQTILEENSSIFYYSSDLNKFKFSGPNMSVGDDFHLKGIDQNIGVNGDDVTSFRLLRAGVGVAAKSIRQEVIKEFFTDGNGRLLPRFTLKNWPKDPLMTRLRLEVGPMVDNFVKSSNFQGDPIDLKIQTMFRLSTFSPSDIFVEGDALVEYLNIQGANEDWLNILAMDLSVLSGFHIKNSVIKDIIDEQARVSSKRLKESRLPLKEMFNLAKTLKEDWFFSLKQGRPYFLNRTNNQTLALKFSEVDPDFASDIFNDLHYIHSPLVNNAFGLFIPGQDTPISVMGAYKIDTNTRRNVLLANGYDPDKSLYLSRLYSCPGIPRNVSSGMVSLVSSRIANMRPDLHALITSFMPSFATGLSLVAGGFSEPILAKELKVKFVKDQNGDFAFSPLRSKQNNALENQIPLLPSLLLLKEVNKPRFGIPDIMKNKMIDVK